MAKYSVTIAESAEKEFLDIPFPFRRQINQRLNKLKVDPRAEGASAIGESDRYRLDIAGWRVLYSIDDERRVVSVLAFRKIDEAPA